MAAVPAMHRIMTEIAATALSAEKRLLTVGIFLMIAMMISFVILPRLKINDPARRKLYMALYQK
ncbi:hypothetical protein ASD15_00380 [Massilia sp. Root351]|nr:hypothetical protein ASD15_00380 [Massilia sp. Root351]